VVGCVELEQEEALRYLRGWLQNHPKYGTLVPGDPAERLIPSEVSYRLGANWYVAYCRSLRRLNVTLCYNATRLVSIVVVLSSQIECPAYIWSSCSYR
jgi:hypothetical protein